MFYLKITLLALAGLLSPAQAQYGFAVRTTLEAGPGCNPINEGAERKLEDVIEWALFKAEDEGVIGYDHLPATAVEDWENLVSYPNGTVEQVHGNNPKERRLQTCNEFCEFMCKSGVHQYCHCCGPCCGGSRRRFLRAEVDAEVQPAADRVEQIILESLYSEAEKHKLKCVKSDPYEVDVIFQKFGDELTKDGGDKLEVDGKKEKGGK